MICANSLKLDVCNPDQVQIETKNPIFNKRKINRWKIWKLKHWLDEISNKLPVAIQNSIYVGCASRLIVSLEFDLSFGRLTQHSNQYKTNYRQYQTWQEFDYHTECPKVDTISIWKKRERDTKWTECNETLNWEEIGNILNMAI